MSIRIGSKKITSGLGVKGEIGKLSELTDALVNDEQDGQIIQYQDEHWVNVDKFTPAEKAAVESGINATKVNTYDNHVTDADKHIITQTQQAAVNSGINQSIVSSISSHINMGDSLHLNTQAKKDAATSGITAEKVSDYDTHIADEDIHVTAEDKARWDAGKTYKEGTGIDITDKEETITPAVPSEVELETTVEDVTELELDDMDKFEAHVQEDGDYTLTFNQGYWYFGEERTTPEAFGIIFHNESGSLTSGETITAHYTKGTPEVKGINSYISTDKTVFRNLVGDSTPTSINIQVDNSETASGVQGSSNSVFIGSNATYASSSVVIGKNATTNNAYYGNFTVVGSNATASNHADVVIGNQAKTAAGSNATSNIAIGKGATVSPGTSPSGKENAGIAIGRSSSSTTGISLGTSSKSTNYGIALGEDADASGKGHDYSSIAIGKNALANASKEYQGGGAVAIGDSAKALGTENSIAIGAGAVNNGYGTQIGPGTKDDSNVLLQVNNYPVIDIAGKIINDRFDKLIKRIDSTFDTILTPIYVNGPYNEDIFDKYLLSSLYQWADETNTNYTHNYIYELKRKSGTYKRKVETHKLKLKSFDADVFFQKVDDVLDANNWGSQVDFLEICYNFPETSYWGPEGWNIAFYTTTDTNNVHLGTNKNFSRKLVPVNNQSEWGFEAELTGTYAGDHAYISFIYRRQGKGAFVYQDDTRTNYPFEVYVDASKLLAKSRELGVSPDGWHLQAISPLSNYGPVARPFYFLKHDELSTTINDPVGTGGKPDNWWTIPSEYFGMTMNQEITSMVQNLPHKVVYKEPLELVLERVDVQPNEAAGAIDAAIEAHNLDSEAHEDIRQRIDELQLMKFPNANIIGEPLINGGNVSRFSNTNYLIMPGLVDVRNKKFEINFCYITGNDINTQQNILDSKFGLAIAIKNGHWVIAASSTGKNWDIGSGENTGTYNVESNTSYECKLTWDKSRYIFAISKDHGETWTNDIVIGSTAGLFPQTIYIGGAPDGLFGQGSTSHPCTEGTINFNHCYLKIADLVVWEGMADAGLATRATVSLDNLDEAGRKKITYTGGTNVTIVDNVISVAQTPTSWGAISGTLSSQTDLKNALDDKQDVLTEGDGIDIVEATTTSGTGENATSTTTHTIKVDDTVLRNMASGVNSIIDIHSGTEQAPTKDTNYVEMTVIGKTAYCSGKEAKDGVLFGYNAKNIASSTAAKRENFTAIGANSTVNNSGTTAIGANASATSTYSTALGYNANTGTSGANVALGANTSVNVSSGSGIAIGYSAVVNAEDAIQIGTGTNNTKKTVQIGTYPLMDENGYIYRERLDVNIIQRVSQLPNPMLTPLGTVYLNQSDGSDGFEADCLYKCVEDKDLVFVSKTSTTSISSWDYEITDANKLLTSIENNLGQRVHKIEDTPSKYNSNSFISVAIHKDGTLYLKQPSISKTLQTDKSGVSGSISLGSVADLDTIEQTYGIRFNITEVPSSEERKAVYFSSVWGTDPEYQYGASNNTGYYNIDYNKFKSVFENIIGENEGIEFRWTEPTSDEETGYWTLYKCTYKSSSNNLVIDQKTIITDNISTVDLIANYGITDKSATNTVAGHENSIKYITHKLIHVYGRRWEKIDFGGGITEVNWGAITGDITSQTDLQNALNNKQDNLTFGTGLSNIDNVVTTQSIVFRTWKEE